MIDGYQDLLRARGPETPEGFESGMEKEGAIAVDTNVAENAMIKIDKLQINF